VILGDGEGLMRVPEEVRESVVFLCSRLHDQYYPRGTAFFIGYGRHTAVYLVTAKHVIDGIRHLKSEGKGDGLVYLRVNRANGGPAQFIEVNPDLWETHDDKSQVVDATVLEWQNLDSALEFMIVPQGMFATPDKRVELAAILGPGTELFMTGMFVNHFGNDRNEPIVRTGNIAAIPDDPVKTTLGPMQAILAEARSIGGPSGSPVFADIPLPVVATKPETGDWVTGAFFLLGLMHGHWDAPADAVVSDSDGAVNMGIGIVVPIEKIVEILEKPIMKRDREDMERKMDEGTFPRPT
jgi:hypothetical protein